MKRYYKYARILITGTVHQQERLAMYSVSTIFRLLPFEPKRLLVLPCEGGEIILYVVDGRAQLNHNDEAGRVGQPQGRTVLCVEFTGFGSQFDAGPIDVLPLKQYERTAIGIEFGHCEVAFRLIPKEGGGQRAEVVAISFDGCKTFYNNKLCTLPREYEEPEKVQTG